MEARFKYLEAAFYHFLIFYTMYKYRAYVYIENDTMVMLAHN
jgi:hypothetical protein